MLRIVILTFSVIATTMLYAFAHASPRQQQQFPAPMRAMLYGLLDIVETGHSEFDRMASGRLGRHVGDHVARLRGDAPAPLAEAFTAMDSDLSGSSYTDRLMPKSTLVRSRLNEARFTRTILDGSLLDGASFVRASVEDTDMKNVTGRAADFTGARFTRADLTGALMQSARFAGASFNQTSLSNAQFSGADFSDVTMADGFGDRSIYYEADFSRAVLKETDFRRANFTQAVFKGATLDVTNLTDAVLEDADFSAADLSTARGLRQDQLDTACGDALTLLPDGLTIPICSNVRLVSNEPEPDNP